ncbi:MAG: GAF domain-containing protein [Magnetococcus sp. MYC-9]
MSFDLFGPERRVMEQGAALLGRPDGVDFHAAYQDLLGEYKRLARVSRRLVSMGDRSEEALKRTSARLKLQQIELEKAHDQLGRHADILEEQVKARTSELMAAQDKLEQLVGLGIALSQEHDQARFMEMILQGARSLAQADGGMLFLRDEEDVLHCEIIVIESLHICLADRTGRNLYQSPVPIRDPATGQADPRNLLTHTLLVEQTIQVGHSYEDVAFDFSCLHALDEKHRYRSISLLSVPLKFRQGDVRGVLLLINARHAESGAVVPFSRRRVHFVESLASQAAVALDNSSLVTAQERLMESIIMLMAAATDAKSPYTGGHCARVPELCRLLAEAMCETKQGAFAEAAMSAEEHHAFRLAAWLHDCGKVATPEYVVDKATKLEAIHNRIHEIRTRFEVLHRDITIEYQQALLTGGQDPEWLHRRMTEAFAVLEEEFAFVARCNVGGEFMTPEQIARLEQIGARTWERHFDDRLGLSYGERKRLDHLPGQMLPAWERLLDDKPEHLFPRDPGDATDLMEKYGIRIPRPTLLYNRGELYNLRVSQGTLTEEERFKVNEHAILTIIMLGQLPFPKHLAQIPEIAGGHHETMIGTGYPRRLTRSEMSVQARMLAIADIFEALTAADRPYKEPKRLSEALAIMRGMRDRQQIDADLFALFLTSGVYQRYAEQYLMPEQLDSVDIQDYLPTPPPP